MSKEIKTKSTIKDIKVFDRTADVGTHMKNAVIKSKDAVESADRQAGQTQDTGYSSPSEYASDQTTAGARNVAERAANGLRKNPVKKASESINKAKQNMQKAKRQVQNVKNAVKKPATDAPKKEMIKRAQDKAWRTASRTRQTAEKSVKTMGKSGKTIKQAAHGAERTVKTASKTVKGTAKATQKTVKTAERTAKVTVKTAQQTAKASQRVAQAAAKAAKAAVQASKAAAKAAIQTAKIAIKVTIATVKVIIAATKALIAAIAAGGWVAVVIILIVVLFGSVLALFGGSSGNTNSYTPVSAEVEAYAPLIQKYAKEHGIPDYVELIKAVMMQESGGRGNDPMQASECGYNTRYPNTPNAITDPEYSINVGIQNLAACLHLADVKNPIDMENIKLALQGYNFGNGYISWAKTNHGGYSITNAIEFSAMMAEKNGWDRYGDTQYVPHVLRYYPFGHAFLDGGNQAIIDVALSQLGNVNGEPYWSWYGFSSREPWCACFVSWCADQCGYIEAGIIPKFAACESEGIVWFREQGLWQEPGYTPAPGDIIFFDWEHDGYSDHVGIVEYVEGDVVHTVEGNTSNSVARRSYGMDSNNICGYGTPMY